MHGFIIYYIMYVFITNHKYAGYMIHALACELINAQWKPHTTEPHIQAIFISLVWNDKLGMEH